MNKYLRAITGAVCAASVLFTGVTVFAGDERKTPSGVAYEDIGTAIDIWANENPDGYVSFVTAAFNKDELLYEGAYGQVDRENNITATTESVYEWGSISKLTVWVSVMQLYEQGKIDLNADVRTYLPEGFFKNLKYDDPITMLHLMNHTAGWGEGTWNVQVDKTEDIMSLGDALRYSEPPQIYRPGEVCSYSNWGAALAGYIVECITGQSYADYARENIFEPLGMEHTSILPDHSDNAWVQQKRMELVSYNFDGSTWNANGSELLFITLYPAGAVTGTIGDLAKFAQSFVREDHPLFEKQETLDLMFEPSSYLGDTDIPNCCHGLWLTTHENVTMIGHEGGTNCCSSNLAFDPETGFGYVFMTSSGGKAGIDTTLCGEITTPDMSKYAGTVTNPGEFAGVYAGCRSIRRGFFKIYGMLSILPASYTGDNTYDVAGVATIHQLNDNVCTLEQTGTYPAYVYTTSDGTKILTLGSQSFALDNTIVPSLTLLVIYIGMCLVGVLMLIFKLIGLISRKLEHYQGLLLITITQIIRPAVIIPLILLLASYSHYYGITQTQGYIVFGTEAICLAVFCATLVSSAIGVFSKSEDAGPKWKYIMSILGNGVSIAMMLLLELVNIWGI
jgi:CubicO group peptidase (beta-lactamase class C family)